VDWFVEHHTLLRSLGCFDPKTFTRDEFTQR
jgi:hypothetical protein